MQNSVIISSQIPVFTKLQIVMLVVILLSASSSGFVRSTGMLKMCPPGGEAFATAWQLTCGMRKKRSVPEPESDIIKELQKEIHEGWYYYCCAIQNYSAVSKS